MATGKVHEVLPPVLDSNSEPPTLFDGTTRKLGIIYSVCSGDSHLDRPLLNCEILTYNKWLYTSYICPYAQRVWIVRNYKGLQDVIKLVPIDLGNRPAWYKEKVYPPNKVPSLEHNDEIKGESLDLIKYVDSHFEGPSLLPEDPAKRKFTEEMFSYSDKFNGIMRYAFSSEEGVANEIDGPLDHLENALSKFDDGPFFLGQFSLVDIAYAPFFERPYLLFLNLKNYDITTGRPKLKLWFEEMNKIDGYVQTRRDPQELVAVLTKHFTGK